MRLAARFFLCFLSFLLIFALLLPSFSTFASAQTTQPAPSQIPYAVSPYAQPNLEPNVPQNMHTLVQSVFLEMMLALGCQLSGIDLSSPRTPCLAPNPFTSKIGYAPVSSENRELQIGGLLGVVATGIGTMYTPTITTSDYTSYLAGNFGLVKQSLAAPPRDAFEGFSPLLGLWKASRDISYFLLILAFVFIGIGVMMRIQLDPRTVMTIQNQIPRVIIAIILITFSYSIAAVMADLMWASTYLVINVVQGATNKTLECKGQSTPISTYATNTILANPFGFVNRVFLSDNCDFIENGVLDLSRNVSNNITGLEKDVVMSVFGLDPDATCSWNQGSNSSGGGALNFIPGVATVKSIIGFVKNPGDIGDCIFYGPFGKIMDWFVSTAWQIVVFIALVITLVRIWFMLLRAYAHIFLYVVLAPIFIVVNLLPKRPLGMERWLRVFFVNLAIFPVTVLMLLLSRAFMDMFDQGTDKIFVPPLIGNPNHDEFGSLIGFATLLIIPGMYSLLREKMSLQDIKQTALAGQTFSAARGAGSLPARQMLKHLNQKDQYGNPVGPLAVGIRKAALSFAGEGQGRFKVPWLTKRLDEQQYRGQNWGSMVGYQRGWQYKDALDKARDSEKAKGSATEADKVDRRAFGTNYGTWIAGRDAARARGKGHLDRYDRAYFRSDASYDTWKSDRTDAEQVGAADAEARFELRWRHKDSSGNPAPKRTAYGTEVYDLKTFGEEYERTSPPAVYPTGRPTPPPFAASGMRPHAGYRPGGPPPGAVAGGATGGGGGAPTGGGTSGGPAGGTP